jgi:hypothetical protein
MPLPSSHGPAPTAMTLLALVAAAIVKQHAPTWLVRPVADLARESGVRPERVSRLKAKLLDPFLALLRRASQRGRPPRPSPAPARRARPLLRDELLAVAAEIIRHLGVHRRRVQDLVVAARDRLHSQHGLSYRLFCQALGLPERTVRSWAERGPAPARPPGPPPPAPPPPPTRGVGRFDLEVTLPGLQAMADTTDFSLFNVPLKIVAAQDPGLRHQRLWEAFSLEDHEDHDVVAHVVKDALGNRPGAQILTDQGTPFLAEAARQAYEELELEHAPQKEGTPTEKATLERSFLTVKSALAPIVALSARLADAVPALRSPLLAIALGRILIATFLRVYIAARDAPQPHRPADPIVLEALAEAQREKARAETRSVKLALESLFDRYQFEGSRTRFVRAHRYHRVEDVLEAERRMGRYACRCHARVCDRYFVAILAQVARERSVRRERERRERLRRHQALQDADRARAENEHARAHPEDALARALHLVALQFVPEKDGLLFGGVGLGRRALRETLLQLRAESPDVVLHRVEVGWRKWLTTGPDSRAIPHLHRVLDDLLGELDSPGKPDPLQLVRGILSAEPRPPSKPRPSPGSSLRISAAGSGST